MNSSYIQKFARAFNISFLNEIPSSFSILIETLQTTLNWDNIYTSPKNTPQNTLNHISLFSIESVMDLGNPEEESIRKKNSQLLFILSNRSESNPMLIKAFEHQRLDQIRDELNLENLINKIVIVSGKTPSVEETLLINDKNFKVFEILNNEQEKQFIKNINEADESNQDLFFDKFFNQDNSKIYKIHEAYEFKDEDSDAEINEIEFQNLKQ